MMVDSIRDAQGSVEVVVAVVGIDVLARQRGKLGVGTLVGPRIGQPESGGPMTLVERIGAEDACTTSTAEPAGSEVVRKCRSGKKGSEKQKGSPCERRQTSIIGHDIPQLVPRRAAHVERKVMKLRR
jgi:hypothetical protein